MCRVFPILCVVYWLPLLAMGFTTSYKTEDPRIQRQPPPMAANTVHKAKKSLSSESSAVQEWDVDLYRDCHSFVWEYGSSLVDLLDPKPGERILDVGCGSGELTNQISERGSFAIGIDMDRNMVDRAANEFPNAKFYQADVAKLDANTIDEPLVDAIFSNAALHWVNDAEAAVACMSRMLKPNGRFVVEFGGNGNVRQIVETSLKVVQESNPKVSNPWYFPSIAEYSSILEREGIEVLSATLFDRPTKLEGENGMKNWLAMFGDVIFKEVSGEKKKLIDEIVDMLKPSLYNSNDGQWVADYRRIRIIGKKVQQQS